MSEKRGSKISRCYIAMPTYGKKFDLQVVVENSHLRKAE